MEPSPPGWYRDPKRPGGRRYWDGHAWVDVDGVVDGPPGPGPVTTGPRIVAQRRGNVDPPKPTEAPREAPTEVVDEIERERPAD